MRRIYSIRLTVGAKAKIAILNVGNVRHKVRAESPDNRELKVLHNPGTLEGYQSHSGIYNLKQDDELIAELITQVVNESRPARTPK